MIERQFGLVKYNLLVLLFLQELIGSEIQRRCETLQIVERDIACLTFDVRYEGPVKPGLKCEHLLRPATLGAASNEI